MFQYFSNWFCSFAVCDNRTYWKFCNKVLTSFSILIATTSGLTIDGFPGGFKIIVCQICNIYKFHW